MVGRERWWEIVGEDVNNGLASPEFGAAFKTPPGRRGQPYGRAKKLRINIRRRIGLLRITNLKDLFHQDRTNSSSSYG